MIFGGRGCKYSQICVAPKADAWTIRFVGAQAGSKWNHGHAAVNDRLGTPLLKALQRNHVCQGGGHFRFCHWDESDSP